MDREDQPAMKDAAMTKGWVVVEAEEGHSGV